MADDTFTGGGSMEGAVSWTDAAAEAEETEHFALQAIEQWLRGHHDSVAHQTNAIYLLAALRRAGFDITRIDDRPVAAIETSGIRVEYGVPANPRPDVPTHWCWTENKYVPPGVPPKDCDRALTPDERVQAMLNYEPEPLTLEQRVEILESRLDAAERLAGRALDAVWSAQDWSPGR